MQLPWFPQMQLVPLQSLSDDVHETSDASDTDESMDSMQSGEPMDGPSSNENAAGTIEKSPLPTEDDFFELNQMEKFVEEAEQQDPEEGGNELGDFDNESDPELDDHLYGAEQKGSDASDGQEDSDAEGFKQGEEIFFDDFFKKQPKQTKSSGGRTADLKEPCASDPGKGHENHRVSGSNSISDVPHVKPISNQELTSLTLGRQIEKLEESALAPKPWPLQGEVRAGDRPLNSALEVDLDFDTSVRPPPEPTEEATEALEELIKRRIADHSFDDVVRIVPPPIDKKRKLIELDNSKGKQGLGEVYEADYVRTMTGGGVEDKDEALRREAMRLFKELSLSLDALTHFHFSPKPVIEEMEVRADVPAIVMEEALPIRVSNASMKAPEDVYISRAKGGDVYGENERSQAERKQLRRQLKRRYKNRQKNEQNGGLDGGKLESSEGRRDRKSLKQSAKRGKTHDGTGVDYGKSREVFRTLQEEKEEGKVKRIKADIAVPSRAAQLKL